MQDPVKNSPYALRCRPTLRLFPVVHSGFGLGLALALLLSGCRTPPDLRPFADATAQLSGSIKLTGRTVVSEINSMSAGWDEVRQTKAREIADKFSREWVHRNGLADALLEYSASLTAIAQAGEQGEKSARALADSFKKLCGAIEVAMPPAAAVEAGINLGAQLYGRFARDYAARTLGQGMKQLQPSIDETAALLGHSLEQAENGLDTIRDQIAANLENEVMFQQGDKRWLVRQERNGLNRLLDRRSELLALLGRAKAAQDGLRQALIAGADAAREQELQRLAALNDDIVRELAAVEASIKTTTDRLAPFEARKAADRERLTTQITLVRTVRSGLADWASAHSRLAAAALEKQPLQVEDLVQTALEIRDLVNTIRTTPKE